MHAVRILILFSGILLLSACSSGSGFKQVVKHPGKYDLIYFGYQTDNPSKYKALVGKTEFFVEKDTVVPSIQSVFLLENTLIKEGEMVLDIGTGSGIQAIFAARNAKKVIATDINPNAIESTLYNANYHGLTDKIEGRLGDLFEPVKADEMFDVIIFNIDYPYDQNNRSLWEVHERFFAQVGKYLKYNGRIYYQAGWLWNLPKILDMIHSNGFKVNRMNMIAADQHNREPIVFELLHGKKGKKERKKKTVKE